MSNVPVTYHELLTHIDDLEIRVVPWDCCSFSDILGDGASMNVLSGIYNDNGMTQKVAFKYVRGSLNDRTKLASRSRSLKAIHQEIRIMGCLRGHPHIVQLLAISFRDHTPVLILELAKFNLEEYLGRDNRVGWNIKLGIMHDIALGLDAIHKAKAVHGDLKAANILIFDGDNDWVVAKISDFGLSSTDLSVQQGRPPGFTNHFRSLECFDPRFKDWNGKHTTDVYSYGLVVDQIAHNGAIPFESYKSFEIDDMKREGTEVAILMELLPEDTPTEVRTIIKSTVRNIPSERWSLEKIMNILKKSTECYNCSYKKAKIDFESFVRARCRKSIGVSKMNILSIPPSLKKSIFREYQRLADTEDITSLYKLGSCWFYGFGVEKDHAKAVDCYIKAAGAGDINAQVALGLCYYDGLGVSKDYIKAAEWYTKAAEADDTGAQANLGVCYQNGLGVTRDYVKAFDLYLRAAEAGNIKAQANLGLCYHEGLGTPKDHFKAVIFFKKAVEGGDTSALVNLGICYENGLGVAQDYIKAVELYTNAAEAGKVIAQFNLGVCYQNGLGTRQDRIKAVEWYTKAAEAGYAPAKVNLGFFYGNGFGVPQNHIKAVELYTEAAKAGNVKAQFNLAYCYQNGYGVTKDYIKAVEWYKMAADAGDTNAQFNLAFCYRHGQGVIKDYVKAFGLYTKMMEDGSIESKRSEIVKRIMSLFLN